MSHHKLHWAKPESEANYKTSCVDSVNSLMWKTLLDKKLFKHISTYNKLSNFCILYDCNLQYWEWNNKLNVFKHGMIHIYKIYNYLKKINNEWGIASDE